MRVVFFGTPDFAVPTLEALARSHEIVAVVAQPDRPAGRGLRMQTPAVAVRARELGLDLEQPARIRGEDFLTEIDRLKPDAGVVVAYGKILPTALLAIPKHGFLNVHASVLPKYRGAAPIQRAIEAGETTTGVTIMRVDEELDHGPVLDHQPVEIGPDEHFPALSERLAHAGAGAMVRALEGLESGALVETPQNHTLATQAPKVEKREGLVTFTETTANIYNRFRAFDPWPGIFLEWRGETIKLTAILRGAAATSASGTIRSISADGVVVSTSDGTIRIIEAQRPGKARTAAAEVARALGWRVGDRLA